MIQRMIRNKYAKPPKPAPNDKGPKPLKKAISAK